MRNPVAGLFIGHWYLFAIGAFLAFSLHRPSTASTALALASVAAAIVIAFVQHDPSNGFAAVAAIAIMVAARTGKLTWKLGGRAVMYLGAISYSLYLVHPLVGNRALRQIVKMVPIETLGATRRWLLMVAAVAVSVSAAHLLWRFVERPAHQLSRRVKLKGSQTPVSSPAKPA